MDSAAACLAGWLAFILYYAPASFMPPEHLLFYFAAPSSQYAKLSLMGGMIFCGVSFAKYGRTMVESFDRRLRRLISTWFVTLLIVVAILFLFKTGSDFSRGWMIVWAIITPFFLAGSQTLERRTVAALREVGFAPRRVAIVGATEQAGRILDHMTGTDDTGSIDVVGVFDDRVSDQPTEGDHPPLRGSIFELKRLCRFEPVDAIVIALPSSDSARISGVVERLMEVPADVYLGPDLAHFDLALSPSTHLGQVPVTSLTRLPMRDWAGIAKWIEDKVIVLAAALFLAPLLALVAILIKLDSPGPVLFKQRRFGFNNVAFDVYKFRTMVVDQCDATGARQTTKNDRRVTRIGRFLRCTSIDELPQLINVWIGDMSIVGPRAHPVGMMVANQPYHEIVRHYAARHRVKPGITGLAQIKGNRGEVDTQEKAERRVFYDLFYIDNWSIWLDLSIIIRTVIKLPFDRAAY